MTSEEKARLDGEAALEPARLKLAGIVSAIAAVVALVLAIKLACGPGHDEALILQPLLALVLSVALVLGARALDGPIRLSSRRREASSGSAAASVLLLWLGCFCVIQIAFLLVNLLGRMEGERMPCTANSGERFRGELKISANGTTRTLAVTGCGIERSPDSAKAGRGAGQTSAAEVPAGEVAK